MGFSKFTNGISGRAKIFNSGLTSKAMLLRYNTCFLNDRQTDGWVDGQMDG